MKAADQSRRRMIGVSLGARTTAEALDALQEIAALADIAEIRLDFMAEYDLPRLLKNRPCPVIVTNRPEREGGRYRGDERERVRPLLEAIDLGAEYVDIEHDATHLIGDRKSSKLIVSYHDFHQTPDNFVQIHREIAAKGADVVKIVGMAQRLTDNLLVFDALAQTSLPTISIAMGEAGQISRVLALRFDTCLLTYATLGKGERVAPGQLAVATMRDVYQADKIDGRTATYAVLGREAASDDTLAALNRATREADVNAIWVPFAVGSAEDPAVIVRSFGRFGVDAAFVLESARQAIVPALDGVESGGPNGEVSVVRRLGDRFLGSWSPSALDALAAINRWSVDSPRVPARL